VGSLFVNHWIGKGGFQAVVMIGSFGLNVNG